MKCSTCNKEYSTLCDYNQGRCPHHPALMETPTFKKILFLATAPLIIGAWVITNPCKAIEQAKKDLNLK